jgi:hypothetical protein
LLSNSHIRLRPSSTDTPVSRCTQPQLQTRAAREHDAASLQPKAW